MKEFIAVAVTAVLWLLISVMCAFVFFVVCALVDVDPESWIIEWGVNGIFTVAGFFVIKRAAEKCESER